MSFTVYEWAFWSRYSDWGAKRAGKIDGQLTPSVPDWKETRQPPYIVGLKQVGDSSVREISQEWAKADSKLLARVLEIDHAHEQAVSETGLRQTANDAATKHFVDLHNEPPPPTSSRPVWYWLLLALLAFLELPMNSIVFELFGGSKAETYVVASAVGLALVACAHYLGELLAEERYRKIADRIIIAVLLVVPIAVVAGVAYLREAYVHDANASQAKFDDTALYITLAAFNLIIFAVATVASYRVHKRGLAELLVRTRLLGKSKNRAEALQKMLRSARVERQMEHDRHRERANQIRDAVDRKIAIYREHNLRNRTDRADHAGEGYPVSFGEAIEVVIPPNLAELSPEKEEEGADSE